MSALTVTAANVSANPIDRGAIVRFYTAGETLTLGQAVYLDASNKAWKTKSDSAAHAAAVGVVSSVDSFYADTTSPAGGTVGLVIYGPVWGFSGLASGQVGWVSATAGVIDDTAPTGGAYQFQVGHAVDDQTFFVDPGTASPVSHS